MSYFKVDPIINRWTRENSLVVLTELGEVSRRVIHISSERAETFQIVIEPENERKIRVDAHLIETGDAEEEVHYIWECPIHLLYQVLDVSLESIKIWFSRPAR